MIDKEEEEIKIINKLQKEFLNVTKIGVGGSSIVFSGINKKTNQEKVLKVINLNNKNNRKIFENERKISKRIAKRRENENLLYSEDTYTLKISQIKYGILTLEKMDMDLLDYLLLHRLLDLKTAKLYFRQICQSISQLHQAGIAHLDIKPENLLLKFSLASSVSLPSSSFSPSSPNLPSQNVVLKFADFGFARYWGEKECKIAKTNGFNGTRQYSAPELYSSFDFPETKSKFNMEKADIWSLGVLLFTMLTGCFPFSFDESKNEIKRLDASEIKKMVVDDVTYEFLSLMLKENFSERISARELLSHRWFDDITY